MGANRPFSPSRSAVDAPSSHSPPQHALTNRKADMRRTRPIGAKGSN